MDIRKLALLPEESRVPRETGYLDPSKPALLVSKGENNDPAYTGVHGIRIEDVDGQAHVAVGTINGVRYYPIVRDEDVRVNEARGEITFSSYGKIYTVRAFQDTDGSWASKLRTTVPAQALEEIYMEEVDNAFSPNAPAQDENLYAAIDGETDEVKYLVYSTNSGMYTRNARAWFKVPKDDESLDGLEVYEVSPKFIKVYDMAEGSEDQLLADDVRSYEVEFPGAITAAGDPECPPATQDIVVNLKNRELAIKNAGYGPLNPNEPNDEFWDAKGQRWGVSGDEARKSTCGNCVMFIRTPKMLNCIATGLELGESPTENAWDAIDTAELGYCEGLDFKCAASRTCDAWVVGGPITDSVEEE
jgi:hypothetical protein